MNIDLGVSTMISNRKPPAPFRNDVIPSFLTPVFWHHVVETLELSPQQARIVELLVERVEVRTDSIDLLLRVDGLTSLCSELRGASAHQEAA